MAGARPGQESELPTVLFRLYPRACAFVFGVFVSFLCLFGFAFVCRCLGGVFCSAASIRPLVGFRFLSRSTLRHCAHARVCH
jgi:hypothetical protein